MTTAGIVEHPTEAEIDEALEETFPASDPPAWTRGIEPARADERGLTTDERRGGSREAPTGGLKGAPTVAAPTERAATAAASRGSRSDRRGVTEARREGAERGDSDRAGLPDDREPVSARSPTGVP